MKLFASLMCLFVVVPALCQADAGNRSFRSASGGAAAQDSIVQLVARLYGEGKYTEAAALVSLDKTSCASRDSSDALQDSTETAFASPRLQYYAGMSHAALYDYPRAQQYLALAVRYDSTNVNYRFQYGRLLIQAGFPDEAAQELSACIALDSMFLPASFQLGLLYNARKSDAQKEAGIFSFLLRRNPKDFLSAYYLGEALKRLDLDDSGMSFIRKSVDLNPRYFPSLISLAHHTYACKEIGPALGLYLRAAQLRARDKDLLFYIGECYRKLDSLNAAVTYFKRSIAVDSTHAAAHAQLGYAFFTLGRIDSSILSYVNAIAHDGDNARYYSNLALAYKKVDSVQAVVRTYRKAIDVLHPENVSYAYNNLAGYYYGKNMHREAAEAYRHVADYDPSNVQALFWRAQSFASLRDTASAVAAFEQYLTAIGADPGKELDRAWVRKVIASLKNSSK